MAKEEAKAEAKGEVPPASAKTPMFSKAGLAVLVVLCLVSAGVPMLLHKGKGGDGGAKTEPPGHGDEPPGHAKGFKPPVFRNTVELDEINMSYRDSGAGGPRRSLKVTVVLEVVTRVEPEMEVGEHGGAGKSKAPKGQEEQFEEDQARLRAVQKLKYRIYDKIQNILRGRSPDDFATNELIDQTRQQIRRTLNDEIFGQQEVIQDVVFTNKSQF